MKHYEQRPGLVKRMTGAACVALVLMSTACTSSIEGMPVAPGAANTEQPKPENALKQRFDELYFRTAGGLACMMADEKSLTKPGQNALQNIDAYYFSTGSGNFNPGGGPQTVSMVAERQDGRMLLMAYRQQKNGNNLERWALNTEGQLQDDSTFVKSGEVRRDTLEPKETRTDETMFITTWHEVKDQGAVVNHDGLEVAFNHPHMGRGLRAWDPANGGPYFDVDQAIMDKLEQRVNDLLPTMQQKSGIQCQ